MSTRDDHHTTAGSRLLLAEGSSGRTANLPARRADPHLALAPRRPDQPNRSRRPFTSATRPLCRFGASISFRPRARAGVACHRYLGQVTKEDPSTPRRYITGGAAAIGALTGAALQSVTGDPFASSAAGAALGALLDDIGSRRLSPSERNRIKLATSFAASAIRHRYEAGDDYRTDDFFKSDPYDRSSFEEVAEGVMLAAQREHEELKVPFVGYLLANVAFEETIDRGTANWAIRIASDLSWTQFALLALVESTDHTLPDIDAGKYSHSWRSWSVHKDLADLHTARGLIGAPTGQTARLRLPYINSRLSDMALSNGGALLYNLMQLREISPAMLDELLACLSATDEAQTATS
jgi:hypothetical protein